MVETTRSAELLTGAVVLAAAAGFVVYTAVQTVDARAGGDAYGLQASFRSAEGIGVGTDVRLAGIRIGEVEAITLDPQTYRAETRFSVAGDIGIPEDSAILVASEGLLGGYYVEIIPGGSLTALADGGEILDTQSRLSLVTLLMNFAGGDGAQ